MSDPQGSTYRSQFRVPTTGATSEVARRLREVAETRASCLIALTGYGQPADRERARAAGFNHHLTKPAAPDALLGLIDAWIESSGSQRSPASAAQAASGNAGD